MSQAPETGQPSRYQRSFGGLIGSIIVLVLVVLGIVAFRGAFRTTPEYEPDHIDYRSLVVSIQQTGVTPAYPAELPDGWYVKDATFDPGERPVLDLALTTADDHFAGLHEEDEDVDELVDTYVGTDATEGETVAIDSAVAPRWRTFSDPGGDHGYAADVEGQTVLVYGSAPEDELHSLVESLTTDRLKP
ncbi:MAG TPA: DUF4245 family protein [Nocardioides sp.]|nr:DUF4245 family protein [Nocardioides sp.]